MWQINDKENNLTSERDRNQQDGEDETYDKLENITHDKNITQYDREKKGENDEDILTNDIEFFKWGKN